MFFHEDDRLKKLPLDVVTLNPTMIHRYKGLSKEDKTDTIDTFHITDFLRIERYQVPSSRREICGPPTADPHPLSAGSSDDRMQTALLIKSVLQVQYLKPEDSNVRFRRVHHGLLSGSLSLDEISQMDLKAFAEWLNQAGKERFSDPEKLAQSIQKAICDSHHIGHALQDSIDAVMAYARIISGLKKKFRVWASHQFPVLDHSGVAKSGEHPRNRSG